MRDILGNIIKFCLELFKMFPILTGILSLFIAIYFIKYELPKAYKNDESGLYVYYNRLGLILVAIFISVSLFFIQLFRIL